jgi:flagellar biosynthesis component FlhA
VPVDLLLSVLRLLLDERVSIRNLPLILESIAELRVQNLAPRWSASMSASGWASSWSRG